MNEIGPQILEFNGVPAFVVLRYDEYQRLLAMASGSSPQSADPANFLTNSQTVEVDDLVTPSTDRAELPESEAPSCSPLSDDGLIPHEVVVAAVHNHWSLVRAWREYLGLNQQIMAVRLGVSTSEYEAMESEFARLTLPNKVRLAEGLGLSLQQLVTRGRQRRRRDTE